MLLWSKVKPEVTLTDAKGKRWTKLPLCIRTKWHFTRRIVKFSFFYVYFKLLPGNFTMYMYFVHINFISVWEYIDAAQFYLLRDATGKSRFNKSELLLRVIFLAEIFLSPSADENQHAHVYFKLTQNPPYLIRVARRQSSLIRPAVVSLTLFKAEVRMLLLVRATLSALCVVRAAVSELRPFQAAVRPLCIFMMLG